MGGEGKVSRLKDSGLKLNVERNILRTSWERGGGKKSHQL